MHVLLTGADGFIGKNLCVALCERDGFEVLPVTRSTDHVSLRALIDQADAVIHLAGVNRPPNAAEFKNGNVDLTQSLCDSIAQAGRPLPIAFASSIQATLDNPYGQSKRLAEEVIENYSKSTGAPASIFRFPNVFGKWCRPNYNSAVATFCYQIARGNPIQINDPSAVVRLVYIDDVVASLLGFLGAKSSGANFVAVSPEYSLTVGELADQLRRFHSGRRDMLTDRVGIGLARALYATYVSYLPTESFSYPIPTHGDSRGLFVEMLKTPESGQFSYFTSHPGITRGGHYHHSKIEKFLVIKGRASFRFRHIVTNETYSLETHGSEPVVVETIPGWAHDVTNIGQEELVVMLWANEVFDRTRPDTIASNVSA